MLTDVFDRRSDINYAVKRTMHMLSKRQHDDLDDMLKQMDNMFRSKWSLPDELVDEGITWIHRVTSTDPHDAIRAGTRTLSTVMPRVTLHPLMGNKESRETANQVEKALEWIFQLAVRRRNASLLRDIVLSALLYDEIIVGTWYLPYQENILMQNGESTQRIEAARRYGDFFFNVYNPRDTIVEYSDLMPERVLMKRVVPVQEVIDMWGAEADERLRPHLADVEHNWCTIYDYNEIGWRSVFCYLQATNTDYTTASPEGAIELVNGETDYSFLPVAAKIGGTNLTNEERYKRIPMLWSIYNSGQWETQNILETLLASEGLAYSVSPRYAVNNEFDTDEPVDMDFREPARIVNLRRGQSLQDLRPPQLNQGLEILADRIAQRMDKSTVPRVLQSGDFPAGAAFSSLNLATQSGMKSLTPYKELAEQVLTDMFVNVLNWLDFDDSAQIEAYIPKPVITNDDETGMPTSEQAIEPITIDNSYFDVNRLYLTVELTEDVPTDLTQKVNTAAMIVERLRGSYGKALEMVGEGDAEGLLKLREAEELEIANNLAQAQAITNQADLNFMRMQEDMQMQLQELQQQQQELAMLRQQLEQVLAQAQQGGQGGPQPQSQPGAGRMVAPDGSVPPFLQNRLAARRGNQPNIVGGSVPEENVSPMPSTNPAMGETPPIQGAPGMGLREDEQA